MKKLVILLVILCLGFLMPDTVWSEQEILVSAAISLKNAFTEIGELYEKSHPGSQSEFQFRGFRRLAQANSGRGAGGGLCLGGPERHGYFRRGGFLIPGSRADFAGNSVVLVQPRQATVKLAGFPDLAKPEVKKIAIGNPKTVPAGRYATEVFNYFKLADAIKDKLVLAENVRQVLDYVARGEVDAGLVYQTDAMTRPQEVQVIAAAPPESHKPVVYPLALIKGAANEAAAKEFVALVLSAQGQAVLQKYGFKSVSSK